MKSFSFRGISHVTTLAILIGLCGGQVTLAQPVTTFTGANFNGSNLNESGFIPPDTMGAVGINHYVETINGRTRMYTKDGTSIVNESLNTFFTTRAGLTTTTSFDPRVQFDRTSGRWFATANDNGRNANSSTLLAVSKTSDPTAANNWNAYRFDMDAADIRWADYNTLGISRDWITLQNNMFSIATGGSAVSTQISLLTIPKANLLAGNSTGSQYLNNLNPNAHGFTAHAVTDLGYGGLAPNAYTLSAFNNSNLRISTVSGAAATPSYTGTAFLGVTAVTAPSTVPQSGSSTLVDGGDTRLSSTPVLVNGAIWAVQNVSESSVNRIRLYRVDPSTNTVLNQLTVPVTAGLFTMYPSIAVNPDGDIAIGFSGSNASQFIGAYSIAGRFDGTNFTWGPTQLNAAGVSTYAVDFGSGRFRWGDYTATTLDPADPGVFWTSQEFVSATDVWSLRHTELIPTRAGQVRYQTSANGNFSTAGSWVNGVVPTTTDHAIFSRWGQTDYTVTFPNSSLSLDRLSVRQTGFTSAGSGTSTRAIFSIPSGGTLNLTNSAAGTPSLAIAEFAGQAHATFGGAGTLNTQSAIVAGGVGSVGALTINTAWTNAGNVFIGGTSSTLGGVGTLNVDNGSASAINGTLNLYNAPNGGTSNRVNLGATAGSSLTVAGLADTGTGTVLPIVNLATAASTLTVNGTISSSYAGTIIGPGAVAKSGSGTWTLTGTNTYTGATAVNAGFLLVNGNHSSASGTATISGGTLGGSGTLGGATIVQNGGTLRGGSGTGTGILTTKNIDVANGGSLFTNIAATTTNSKLAVGSNTASLVNGSRVKVTALAGFTNLSAGTWNIAELTNGNNILLNGSPATDNTVIGRYTQGAGTSGAIFIDTSSLAFSLTTGDELTVQRSGSNLVLNFTPVPEPATILAFIALGGGAATLYRRWRRKGPTALAV